MATDLKEDVGVNLWEFSKRSTRFRTLMLKQTQAKVRLEIKKNLKTKDCIASIKKHCPKLQCSTDCTKSFLLQLFPFIRIMKQYSLRRSFLSDIISGFTVGIVHIPQGMAYGMLTGLPAEFGLYTSFFPVLLYFFFGSSKHISMGTFAVVSLMVGNVVDKGFRLYGGNLPEAITTHSTPFSINSSTPNPGINTSLPDLVPSLQPIGNSIGADPIKLGLAMAVTFLVGSIQLLLGAFRMGYLTSFLSDPLISGFTTGAAVHVFSSQVHDLFGIPVPRYSGAFQLINFYRDFFGNFLQINPVTTTTSVTCVFLLILIKEGINNNKNCKRDVPIPIPIELFVVIAGTVVSHYTKINIDFHVDVVGNIPSGLPTPSANQFLYLGDVISDGFAIAFVSFAVSFAMAKILADKHDYQVDANQELVANGICNLVGSFMSCFCCAASLSRSMVQEQSGGKSQISGLMSSILVLIVILYIGPMFKSLPNCILACIVIVSLKGLFKQFVEVKRLWRLCKKDCAVWLVTFIATVILDVGLGLLVGTAFALYFVLRQSQSSIICTLGQVPGTSAYKNTKTCKKVRELLGIKIFRFESSIYFANAEHFRDKLYDKTGVNPRKLKRKKRSALHRALMERRRELEEAEKIAEQKKKNVEEQKPKEKISIEVEMCDTTVDEEGSQEEEEFLIRENREILVRFSKAWNPPIHTLIIDFSVVNYIDTVGIKILSQIVNDFKDVGVKVFIAACRPDVRIMLKKADFYAMIDYNCIYYTIHEAVVIAQELHLADKNLDGSATTLDRTSCLDMETLSTDAGNGSSSDYTPHDTPTYSGAGSSDSISSDSGTVSHNGEFGDIELQTIVVINGSPKTKFRKQMQTIYEPEDGEHSSETSELLQKADSELDATGQISTANSTDNIDNTVEQLDSLNISAAASLGDLANIFGNVHM